FWFGDFTPKSLPDQGKYGGLRLDFAFQIGPPAKVAKLSRIHLDVGFGDSVPRSIEPKEMAQTLPNEEPVSWSTYPAEFILAEKLQTLISRSSANSRAKDVFDLTILFERCSDRARLKEALAETFATRGTPIPDSFVN